VGFVTVTESELVDHATKVPFDTFAARLAVVKAALGGLNTKQAAELCGIQQATWRRWEQGTMPHDLHAACAQIHRATGLDFAWLYNGGTLAPRSRCFTTVPPILGQMELALTSITPALKLHTTPADECPTPQGGDRCTPSPTTPTTNAAAAWPAPRSTRAATN